MGNLESKGGFRSSGPAANQPAVPYSGTRNEATFAARASQSQSRIEYGHRCVLDIIVRCNARLWLAWPCGPLPCRDGARLVVIPSQVPSRLLGAMPSRMPRLKKMGPG